MRNTPVIINNISIHPFTSVGELVEYIVDQKKILIAINAEKILHSTEQVRNIINNNIGYADGMGAIFALRKKGYKNVIKIPGRELWLKVIEQYFRDKSFYLIGGKQEVIESTVEKLQTQFAQINIVNYRNGYFDEAEKSRLIHDIQIKKPDIILVAMGSPQQEIYMNEMLASHPALYIGLGGSFDLYTNNVKPVPRWWVEHNLEWAYRLIKQPLRIKRQIHLLKFVVLLLFIRRNNYEKYERCL